MAVRHPDKHLLFIPMAHRTNIFVGLSGSAVPRRGGHVALSESPCINHFYNISPLAQSGTLIFCPFAQNEMWQSDNQIFFAAESTRGTLAPVASYRHTALSVCSRKRRPEDKQNCIVGNAVVLSTRGWVARGVFPVCSSLGWSAAAWRPLHDSQP
jgi:hypothetical protein